MTERQANEAAKPRKERHEQDAARRRPNIVLIITDQERSHKHWPPGW